MDNPPIHLKTSPPVNFVAFTFHSLVTWDNFGEDAYSMTNTLVRATPVATLALIDQTGSPHIRSWSFKGSYIFAADSATFSATPLSPLCLVRTDIVPS